MNTSILTGEELFARANEFVELVPVGTYESHVFHPGELYLIKTTTRKVTIEHSLKLAMQLATEHAVLYLDRLAGKKETERTAKTILGDTPPKSFFMKNFCTHSVMHEQDEIKQIIEEHDIHTLIMSTFEMAVDSERHKKDLVTMLRSFAIERDMTVIIYTQDHRAKLEAGNLSRGAIGILANLCTEIIDVKKEEAMKPLLEPKPEPAVKWKHKNFPMTYKQRFGVSVASRVHRDDAEFVLDFIKKKRQDFIDGKYKLRKVSEAEEQVIIKKFLDANVEEIKELEERVYQIGLEKQREHELGMDTVDYKMRWG